MEKSRFKKCLHILDKIESYLFKPLTVYETFLSYANGEDLQIEKDEFSDMMAHLIQTKNIICCENCFDLSQSFTIFSRAPHLSSLEALALFEALLHDTSYKIDLNKSFPLEKIDPFLKEIVLSTSLLEKKKYHYYLNKKLKNDLKWIQEDVNAGLNCSDCLKVHYTKYLYEHNQLIFKNRNIKPIPYTNLDKMKRIYPICGIPVNRDCSKELQVFFKDCLFNEFHHSCAICKISLPQMLIASHIKPFRDCGYLVEAMDSNNGLLLCRNHDYLFDQGFISFDDNGQLLISKEITHPDIYQLNQHFMLDPSYLTTTRKMFLEYHRQNLFKDNIRKETIIK